PAACARSPLRRRLGREVRKPRRARPHRRPGLPRTVRRRPDLPRDLPRALPLGPRPGAAAARAPRQKRPPRLERAGWPGEHPEVERFLARVTAEVPQVAHCATFYYNPDL